MHYWGTRIASCADRVHSKVDDIHQGVFVFIGLCRNDNMRNFHHPSHSSRCECRRYWRFVRLQCGRGLLIDYVDISFNGTLFGRCATSPNFVDYSKGEKGTCYYWMSTFYLAVISVAEILGFKRTMIILATSLATACFLIAISAYSASTTILLKRTRHARIQITHVPVTQLSQVTVASTTEPTSTRKDDI